MAEEKRKESEKQEFEFHKPVKRGAWEGFSRFIHNPDTGQFLGRTPKSWVLILVFYVFFYLVLACLFGGCMFCFYKTIDLKQPRRQLGDSLIGESPGLSIRPLTSDDVEGNFIYYNAKNESQINKWIKKLNDFMQPYIVPAPGVNSIHCSFHKRPVENEICKVNLSIFEDCSPKDLYGYRTASPCIFLKLNKIYGWKPETHLLPTDEMPPDLKRSITSSPEENRTQIWVSCNGLTAQDKDYVKEFKYYPKGFPSYFFPYRNGDNYSSPLVAVKIVYPKANVIIGIECRAWAKNIRYHGGTRDRVGSIQFYLQRDYFNVPLQ